jgi:hypothetical protein
MSKLLVGLHRHKLLVDQDSEAEVDQGDSQEEPGSVVVQEWTLVEVGQVEEENDLPGNLDVRKKIWTRNWTIS